jgi:AraC family transcriptional regulator
MKKKSMFLRIENLTEKKLVGLRLSMSLSRNKTFELWHKFMPRLKEIRNRVNDDLISMQVYDKSFDFLNINPGTQFEKWAATEVSDLEQIPDGMEEYHLTGGMYAVFLHKGLPDAFPGTYEYIFYNWLPNSVYILDNREHLEILGEKYNRDDPGSEEEIWIPVKSKN